MAKNARGARTSKVRRIYSWNVNGIRAAARKGLPDWIRGCGADIIGLQEVRASLDAIPPEIHALD
ncbi:MAG: endonuclease/exonuclease/phosphatase family protein, partial [Deltaproteobacteria bacterium]|nr:endonuclease/exonuclease/phosphatase family protein [Deltaproteobacteria bacterium]